MGYNKLATICLLWGCMSATACYSKKNARPAEGTAGGFAVVELFTSEGCSSCPAAEAALASINDEYKDNVYVMEYHVDYWNYIGWDDPFSDKKYSERQRQYASLMHLSSTYTPQAIVNGRSELVGSDKARLRAVIDDQLSHKSPLSLTISAGTIAGGRVPVSYSLSNLQGQVISIAVVQRHAATNVRRGENTGRKLTHINVVRNLDVITSPKNNGTVTVTLPPATNGTDYMLIAYAQDKETWVVNAAAKTGL